VTVLVMDGSRVVEVVRHGQVRHDNQHERDFRDTWTCGHETAVRPDPDRASTSTAYTKVATNATQGQLGSLPRSEMKFAASGARTGSRQRSGERSDGEDHADHG